MAVAPVQVRFLFMGKHSCMNISKQMQLITMAESVSLPRRMLFLLERNKQLIYIEYDLSQDCYLRIAGD